ncbi:MAG: host-nuclease inhibitor Gam family protein [Nitrospirota bacterium]
MATMEEIELAAKRYHEAEEALAEAIRAMQDAVDKITRHHLPVIKRKFERAGAAYAELHSGISASPELFRKPRSRVFHGVTVGIKKEKGRVIIADEEATVKLIERHLKHQVDILLKITKKPVKKALQGLSGADLKKIGVTIDQDTDNVYIALVASEVEKMIQAFREEYMAKVQEKEEMEAA